VKQDKLVDSSKKAITQTLSCKVSINDIFTPSNFGSKENRFNGLELDEIDYFEGYCSNQPDFFLSGFALAHGSFYDVLDSKVVIDDLDLDSEYALVTRFSHRSFAVPFGSVINKYTLSADENILTYSYSNFTFHSMIEYEKRVYEKLKEQFYSDCQLQELKDLLWHLLPENLKTLSGKDINFVNSQLIHLLNGFSYNNADLALLNDSPSEIFTFTFKNKIGNCLTLSQLVASVYVLNGFDAFLAFEDFSYKKGYGFKQIGHCIVYVFNPSSEEFLTFDPTNYLDGNVQTYSTYEYLAPETVFVQSENPYKKLGFDLLSEDLIMFQNFDDNKSLPDYLASMTFLKFNVIKTPFSNSNIESILFRTLFLSESDQDYNYIALPLNVLDEKLALDFYLNSYNSCITIFEFFELFLCHNENGYNLLIEYLNHKGYCLLLSVFYLLYFKVNSEVFDSNLNFETYSANGWYDDNILEKSFSEVNFNSPLISDKLKTALVNLHNQFSTLNAVSNFSELNPFEFDSLLQSSEFEFSNSDNTHKYSLSDYVNAINMNHFRSVEDFRFNHLDSKISNTQKIIRSKVKNSRRKTDPQIAGIRPFNPEVDRYKDIHWAKSAQYNQIYAKFYINEYENFSSINQEILIIPFNHGSNTPDGLKVLIDNFREFSIEQNIPLNVYDFRTNSLVNFDFKDMQVNPSNYNHLINSALILDPSSESLTSLNTANPYECAVNIYNNIFLKRTNHMLQVPLLNTESYLHVYYLFYHSGSLFKEAKQNVQSFYQKKRQPCVVLQAELQS
ncbi:MAG: hypothetical protein ACON4M_07150, partial [Crocinitomicaceae bacterium]